MTTTRRYSITHRMLVEVARRHSLVPMDVRVLLALKERGGEGLAEQLESELLCNGSAIRRSLGVVRSHGYVHGGGRQAMREPVALTQEGERLVKELESELVALENGLADSSEPSVSTTGKDEA